MPNPHTFTGDPLNMIKVFNIISHIDIGGAERVAINIAKSKNPEFEYHVVEVVRSFLHY